MPTPTRSLSTALLVALTLPCVSPALAASAPAVGGIERAAEREGFQQVRLVRLGDGALRIEAAAVPGREALIRRASLVAYVVFKQPELLIDVLEFQAGQGAEQQRCRIRKADHALYLADRISRAEYERRLDYQSGPASTNAPLAAPPGAPVPSAQPSQRPSPAPSAQPTAQPSAKPKPPSAAPVTPRLLGSPPPFPPLPPIPPYAPSPEPSAAAPSPAPVPTAAPFTPAPSAPPAPASPRPTAAPGTESIVGFSYGVGFSPGAYDSYTLEYAHPILPTLDVRPSFQILSPFSPINYQAGSTRPLEGMSLGCDLIGTSRQQPNAYGFAFEGGFGARTTGLQGNLGRGEWWPAMHLRLGMRWRFLQASMRYPLLARTGDPTAGWESFVGFSLPLSVLIQ